MCKRKTITDVWMATILMVAMAFSACRNDFEVSDEGEPYPIVYGLLSPAETVQYIRLGRSFVGNHSLFEVALEPDSILFKEARMNVEIRARGGPVLIRYPFYPVLFQDKEEGMFARSPNILFKGEISELPYSHDNTIVIANLSIYIPEKNISLYSETTIPPVPSGHLSGNLVNHNTIDLYRPNMIYLGSNPDFFTHFKLTFYYGECYDDGYKEKEWSYEREYAPVSPPDAPVRDELNLSFEWFYPMVAARIAEDPGVRGRDFRSIEIEITYADRTWYEYFRANQFTSDLNPMMYSNIVNGLGIFSSLNRYRRKNLQLEPESFDSLVSGRHTRHLHFWAR